MEKTDFKKVDKEFYGGKVGRFDVVTLPKMNFLTINGEGDPNTSSEYAKSVAALYNLSYALKGHSKKFLDRDHVVPPLEGLWWADDMEVFASRDKGKWKWRMMIRQPDWVNDDERAGILDQVIAKNAKKKEPPTDEETLRRVEFRQFTEGLCVQILHVGSYDDETPVLAKMHQIFIPDNGFAMRGSHHEIYLSDPRKVAPDKLKTVLRQPVERVG